MSSNHSKRGPSRAVLPRRPTRRPLEDEDPLSASQSLTTSPSVGPTTSPLANSTELDTSHTAAHAAAEPTAEPSAGPTSVAASKDLSFLLDASIYHPLSNIDIPSPYRYPLPPLPPATTPLSQVFSEIAKLLAQCRFLSAAHLAASALTSGLVDSTDAASIFQLLSIRYSALELSGNVLLAAQEAKALEDLSSSFYYDDASAHKASAKTAGEEHPPVNHIMPFDLRLQAMRLQGIGFGDSRRTVGGLFDLGLEIREIITKSDASDKGLWESRLDEVGVRVINALIDLGDLECARRSIKSMALDRNDNKSTWMARLVLLTIKMGEINEARALLEGQDIRSADQIVLQSFIEIAEENFGEAVTILSTAVTQNADPQTVAIAKQNLAVAYLYTGEIERSCQILKDLVNDGYSFHALTVNLATLYDLTSDKSKQLKMELVDEIARTKPSQPQRGFINADFKL